METAEAGEAVLLETLVTTISRLQNISRKNLFLPMVPYIEPLKICLIAPESLKM